MCVCARARVQFINRGWMTFQDLLQCLFGLAMSALGAGDISKLFTDQANNSVCVCVCARACVHACVRARL